MKMDQICAGEIFFNTTEFLTAATPEFSECFQQVVLYLLPCVYHWIFSIPVYLSRRKSYHAEIHPSKLYRCRLLTTIVMKMACMVNVGYSTYEYINGQNPPLSNIFSPGLVGITMVLVMMFLKYDRKKGINTSGHLSCFWTLCLILWGLIFLEKVEMLTSNEGNLFLSRGDLIRCITLMIKYFCVIIHFIMSFFMDGPRSEICKNPYLKMEETNSYLKLSGASICPEKSSSFFSRITFHWFNGMVWTGYKRAIVNEDLWLLNDEDKSAHTSRLFLKYWKEEIKMCTKCKIQNQTTEDDGFEGSTEVLIQDPQQQSQSPTTKPSLYRALRRAFGPTFYTSIFLKFLNDILLFASPQLLSAVISFNESDSPMWLGYLLAILMFTTSCLQSIILNQYFHICFTVGMRVRSALISVIYRKALSLSNSSRKESTAGEIVNLMSVDAQKLQDLFPYLNTLWSGPFQIIIALVLLYIQLGNSIFAGLGVMILLVPLNGIIAKKALKLQGDQMKLKDERIKSMGEILNGIKLLKMYAWEMAFMDKVSEVRRCETNKLRTTSYLMSIATLSWALAPFIVSLVTFAVYVLSDPTNVLDAQTAFVSLALFDLLRFPIIMIPIMIQSLIEAKVSLKRLEKFLYLDELDPDNVEHLPPTSEQTASDNIFPSSGGNKEVVVNVNDGKFTWNNDDNPPTLNDINMNVYAGDLVAVVGQVGCGKSSLISALLGDMEKLNGDVTIKGSTAYVPQQAWIQNLSAKENILFGKKLNDSDYEETVESCQLIEDFSMLTNGDQTEIGERGINLSGGQKQRISIARAVYQQRDIYLLDDPLSAVDAHVGKNIFDKVIGPNGLLRNKTRILVTHGVGYLPQVDQIIVLKEGKISEVGNYEALLDNNGDFAEFLRTYNESDMNINDGDNHELARASVSSSDSIQKPRESKKVGDGIKNDDKLITEETTETGNMKLKDLLLYIKALGVAVFIILIVNLTLETATSVGSDVWLSEWSMDPVDPVTGTQSSTMYRLAVYAALGLGQAVFLFFGSILLTYGSVAAAVKLHRRMLYRIIRAPMSFFDTTPQGRIVNRFSKDIYLIDEIIPHDLHDCLWTLFSVLATIFVVSYSFPIFLAAIGPIMIIYYIVQRVYVKTSRQLKRMESVSRSPIYSQFGESLNGASTIRAYNLQGDFIKENERKIDNNQAAYYPNIVSNRWLGLRVTVVGSLIVFFAALFAVLEQGKTSSGRIGLSLSYAIQTTQIMNWLVRQMSSLESNIVAVERVEEYSNVEQEAPLRCTDDTNLDDNLDDNWPSKGAIKYVNYGTRYRDGLPLVVQDINLDISAGEKIGVVGRTGAGKSSLTLALFRIIESSNGSIFIDDINISNIGLHDLRSKIAIIPQDPILFSGTLRMNLDPFDVYTDDEIWVSLEHSHLKSFIQSTTDKLQHEISEGGDNLSVGQRQLVCLARALLKKSKILVLDEATAAVDLETDSLIQTTIREQFASCTIFTIAHRLNTIMDSDRIAVLDNGKVAQLNSPKLLLEKRSGIFYEMAKDAKLVS